MLKGHKDKETAFGFVPFTYLSTSKLVMKSNGRTTSAIRRSESRESLRSAFQPFQQTPLRLWKPQPQPQPSPARLGCRVREFEQPCRAACEGSTALRGALVPRAPSRCDR